MSIRPSSIIHPIKKTAIFKIVLDNFFKRILLMILCVMIRPARQYSAHFFDRLCPRIAYRKALCLPDLFVIRLPEESRITGICDSTDSPHFASLIRLSRPSDYNGSKPAYVIASKVSRLPRSIGATRYDKNPGSGIYHSWE